MDGMLSQEEINALLSGMSSGNEELESVQEQLTADEKDAIGEISNISMGTAATTLFSLVNHKVTITTPVVTYATWNDLVNSNDKPCVFIQISYQDGLDGNNILILKETDVKLITDLMMGGDGTNISGELSELHLSAIGEAMNQMMGSAATSISSMLEKRVNISPPSASVVNLNEVLDGENIAEFLKGSFVKVSFHMVIGDLVDSELMQLYPFEFARDLYKQFIKATTMEPDIPTRAPLETSQRPVISQPTAPQPMAQPMQAQFQQGASGQIPPQMQQPIANYGAYGGMPYNQPTGMPMAMTYGMPPMQDVNVQPAQFTPFVPSISSVMQPENIGLLMDVPLEVTVELGRTSKSIKEILDFTPGTIIELNRLAGEPIDVLVNGKFVAKGEVVVIEEAFGIRVTEIIKQ